MKNLNKKIFLILVVFINFFIFKTNVYADCITGYYCGHINFNIYDNNTSSFQLYEKNGMMYQQKCWSQYDTECKSEDKDKMIGVLEVTVNNKYTYTATYPKKDGYKFDGWYYDKELTKKVPELYSEIDINLLKSNDYNLYGRWVVGVDDNQNKYVLNKNVYYVHFQTSTVRCKYCDPYTLEEALLVIDGDNTYLTNGKNKVSNSLPSLVEGYDGWYSDWNVTKKLDNNNLKELISLSDKGKINVYCVSISDTDNSSVLNDSEEIKDLTNDEDKIDDETPESIVTNDDDIATEIIEEDNSNTLIYCFAGVCLLLITGITFAFVIIKKGKSKKLTINNIEE